MMTRLNELMKSEEGQGNTEYIVVVALIAIAAIAVVTFFSQNLRALFAASEDSLGGAESISLKKAGSMSPGGAAINTAMRKNLSNFGSNTHIGGGEGGWE